MPIVVGVAFKPVTKVYYFHPADIEDLQPGDNVVVETSRGRTLGRVVLAPHEVPPSAISGTLKPVVRRATAWDMVQIDQMSHREPAALRTCRQRAAALNMDIKIVKLELSFDGSSAVVYFSSEQRVDFRNLVHDLAQTLHTKVEMRQVGVRDEAKFLGGFGRCGRELCCTTWLREFTPVSIKMAKSQDLPLNAPEVSGVCGRLLCCLAYENDFYTQARKQMPRINSIVETPQGPGKVRQVHVLANSITVQVEGPGETRLMVDMPVPEPHFDLSAQEPASSADGPLRKVRSEPEAVSPQEAGNGEGTAVHSGQPGHQPGRRSRSRHKKR